MAAPFRVQVAPGRFRDPDVIFLAREQFARRERLFWRGADLVMEVISEDDPDRDLVMKRAEYAKAAIPESPKRCRTPFLDPTPAFRFRT